MTSTLRAGVARVDITPPIGISMVGYYIREGVSNGVERPLTATALVLASDSVKIAILSCDIVFIQNPHADEIRRRIAAAIGTAEECVIVNCSHTHCGPTLPGFLWQDEDQRAMQSAYLANLKGLLTGVAAAADRALTPARIGASAGSVRIGINRREKDETGKVFLGENPEGPLDTEVTVVRVDELSGKPLAILYNYGCHTVTMGPKCLKLSPDFVGPAREVIESATGARSLFLQGAAGNINPVTGIGATEDDSENMTRLGGMLGAEVVKTAMALRTHQHRGPRTFLSSLAKVSLYPYLPVDDKAGHIAAACVKLELPMLPLPGFDEARRIRAGRVEALQTARRERKPPGVLTVLRHFADWGDKLVRTVEAGGPPPTIPFEIAAVRVDDIAFLAMPCEPLVELGLAVKAASPFERTLFLGYSNGCIGYLSPADAYPEGGWSPWETYAIPDMLFQSYQLPMALRAECGQMVVERSVELLRQLASKSSAPAH